jgi:hypothetical protein
VRPGKAGTRRVLPMPGPSARSVITSVIVSEVSQNRV